MGRLGSPEEEGEGRARGKDRGAESGRRGEKAVRGGRSGRQKAEHASEKEVDEWRNDVQGALYKGNNPLGIAGPSDLVQR